VKRYLIDTGPLTAYLMGRQRAVDLIGPLLRERLATTSALTYGEVVEHILNQPNSAARLRQLRVIMRDLRPIGATYPILHRYATLRRQMRRPYGSGIIGDVDTLIAATALERDLTVVTTDGDFMRVPGLKVLLMLPSTLKSPKST
jgi:predicted nucleic acid-binding protein